MKVFFDTNVYIADALVGKAATRMIEATRAARWRIYTSNYVLAETRHVLIDDLGFSEKLAALALRRIMRITTFVKSRSGAKVISDPKDSPILQAALSCGADYLVTNDRHLLELNPFQGLEIISMDRYFAMLKHYGWIK